MQGNEETHVIESGVDQQDAATPAPRSEIKWHCRKMGKDLDPVSPACPDKNIYCKFRTGCLVNHKSLIDD